MRNTHRYEAKIAVVLTTIPLMARPDAFRLMRIIIEVINESASNSFLRNNINPLRVGLMLYRLIAEITEEFKYSEHTSKALQDKLSE